MLGNAFDVWPKLRSLLRLSPITHPQHLLAEENFMAETTGTSGQGRPALSGQGLAGAKFDEAAASTKSLADQALSAGQDLTEKAKDLAGNSADALKAHASDFADAAKDVASQATDKLKSAVNERKSSGAEYVGTLADTMRRAAREFDTDLPIAGTYIRKAAEQVDGVSEGIRDGNLNDLVRSAQSFARRQPTAFLGIAVLAGFGVVRFLKSSAESGSQVGTSASAPHGSRNQGYRDDFTN
jgi:hypothetical protein